MTRSRLHRIRQFLQSSKQCHLDGSDVPDHGLCRAFRITVLQRQDDVRMLLAIVEPPVFREGLALQLNPGIATANDLQDRVNATE